MPEREVHGAQLADLERRSRSDDRCQLCENCLIIWRGSMTVPVSRRSLFERHPAATLVVALLVAGIVLALCAEFGFRAARYLLRGGPAIERAENADDAQLGWVLNPARQRIVKRNACGEEVVREPPPDRLLAKLPAGATGIPVLFLGDSYTQGSEVSTSGMYYTVFEREAGGRYAVYAAGSGGYGTAQQYLLAHRLLPVVRPRVIFWQLSSNDVAENVFLGVDFSTVQKPRPYFELGSAAFVTRDPSLWLLRNSEFTRFMLGEALKVDRRFDAGLGRLFAQVAAPAADASNGRTGRRVLATLVRKLHAEVDGAALVGFAVDEASPDRDYARAFDLPGAHYLSGFAGRLRSSGQQIDCAPVDPHWNHAGNRVAGRLLLEEARRLLPAGLK
ncbi:MAG: SGNH/GDSL hydrolase family protein [Burkholderiales bacterium]